MAEPASFIVHHIDHARAALRAAAEAGVAVRLFSAPGAAAQGGTAWFREMIAAARAEVRGAEAEAVLDCGAEPGLALAAMRAGIGAIRVRLRGSVRARIVAIAEAAGVAVVGAGRARPLDLLDAPDPLAAARAYLKRHGAAKRTAKAPGRIANRPRLS